MTQKQSKNRRETGRIFLFLVFTLIFFKILMAHGQDLPSVNVSSIDSNEFSGTPIDEIISAVENGGLSGIKDSSALVSQDVATVPDVVAPSETAQPDPPPATLTADSLQTLESEGGISSKPQPNEDSSTIFSLAARFLAKVNFKSDAEFAKRPIFDDGMDISGTPTFDMDTAGFAIIKKGNQSVVIDFDSAYDSPPVVTATLSLQQYKDPDLRAAAEDLLLVSDVKFIVTDVSKKGFQIMMDRKADSDIPFSWHALAVKNPKTFKKEGDIPGNSDNASLDSGGSGQVQAGQAGNSTDLSGTANPAESDFSLTGESSDQSLQASSPGNSISEPTSNGN